MKRLSIIFIISTIFLLGCEEFPEDFTLKLTQQGQGSLYTAELLYRDGKLDSGMQMNANPPTGYLCHYMGEWKFHNGTDCDMSKIKDVPMTSGQVSDKIASGEYKTQADGPSDIVYEIVMVE